MSSSTAARRRADALIDAVRKAGYDAAPAVDPFTQPAEDAAAEAKRYRHELRVFVVAALLTRAVRCANAVDGWRAHALELPVGLQLALATPVQFWVGRALLRRRVEGASRRRPPTWTC